MFCYTDGLVELLLDENKGVSWGTRFIEEKISNPQTIGQNINHIIIDRKIAHGNSTIIDDVSILGVDF